MPSTIQKPHELLKHLRQQYPDTPFIALGQTVFWDEPVKAVLRLLLDELGLGGEMVVGAHDADYFAKAKVPLKQQARFALMPHNDGSTRDIWSAAGEISTLFGSETFPSKHDYARTGVAFDRAARTSNLSYSDFLDRVTEAWGWRGVVYTGSRDLVVNNLSLREVGSAILEMLRWGFENAEVQIATDCCQRKAAKVSDLLLGWCEQYISQHPDHSLSDLFQHILPQIYALLLQREPQNLTVTSTTKLLKFTPETASLPRFHLLDTFLNPETRGIATEAYNQAVAGSEIYTLDKFGAGAIPFDVLVPGRGRGTLRLHPRVLFIETRQPIPIALKEPITNVQQLAEVLYTKFGDTLSIVGKAVSLVSMLASEFLFVFHEEGSMYVWRTKKMNDYLQSRGVAIHNYPILRLRYHTWDALSVACSALKLPEHLASTFGQSVITTPEFAQNWKQVVEEQKSFCTQSLTLKKPTALLSYLQDREPLAGWDEKYQIYLSAKETLLRLSQESVQVKERIHHLYRCLKDLKQEQAQLQKAKGVHFRSVEEWTQEEAARREAFGEREAEIMREKETLRRQLWHTRNQGWHIERGAEAQQARQTLRQIEDETELARLRLVRNALLTLEGLPHTAHRPSAWWLPMVDASGKWFREIAETAECYLEPLLS